MVKVFTLLFLVFSLAAEEVKVETLLDSSDYSVGQEITGTINVTHPTEEGVDVTSFTYQGKPLAVDFMRKVHFPGAESLDLESYRFKLPAQKVGLQVIDPIAVKVGKHLYQSVPVSFEVKKIEAARTAAAYGSKEPFLKLEKIFKAKEPLYPGQKVTLGYRYFFQGSIELREEIVPLIEQTFFPKLGEKQVQDSAEGTVSVREITQQVQVEKPGDFPIPESVIAGYAYIDKGWGPKTYIEPKLTSSVPPFKITVLPFPAEGKPPFFYGAIGPFEVSAHLKAPPRLELGDKFILTVTYSGKGELATLKPPNLSCQPGWAGFFHTGDLPPQGEKKEGEVSFAYELRAENRFINHIPPIFTAYFDPDEKSYKIVATERLPLEIAAAPGREEKPAPLTPEIVLTAHLKTPQVFSALKLTAQDRAPRPLGQPWVLLLMPLALLLFWLRLLYQEYEEKKRRTPLSLEARLKLAKKALPDLEAFSTHAKAALASVWKGEPFPPPVQAFLDKVEAAIWGREKPESPHEYYAELKALCTVNGKPK